MFKAMFGTLTFSRLLWAKCFKSPEHIFGFCSIQGLVGFGLPPRWNAGLPLSTKFTDFHLYTAFGRRAGREDKVSQKCTEMTSGRKPRPFRSGVQRINDHAWASSPDCISITIFRSNLLPIC